MNFPASLAPKATTGRVPLHHDQLGYMFYVIADSKARAELDGQVLNVLGPGDFFGELAFFNEDGRRTADIVAETPLRSAASG